jgi:hypothetical protein
MGLALVVIPSDLRLSTASPRFGGNEASYDRVRDGRPCRLRHPRVGSRWGRYRTRSGARRDCTAARRYDVHARQSPPARPARRREPQPGAIAWTTSWGYARAEWPTPRARSVTAGSPRWDAPSAALLFRQTLRDRGRRSGRRAGGEDGRLPDSPHDRRAGPLRGHIRARGRGPLRAHRSGGRRSSCRGSRVIPQPRARRHDLRADGEGDHRASNRCGHRDVLRDVHNLVHADEHGRYGLGRSNSS